ncbi:MAG: hypothetical protein Q8M29_14955 [Bacteroidota bacterium]|nr:hypothetical protein [Bacteroidota bacterium]
MIKKIGLQIVLILGFCSLLNSQPVRFYKCTVLFKLYENKKEITKKEINNYLISGIIDSALYDGYFLCNVTSADTPLFRICKKTDEYGSCSNIMAIAFRKKDSILVERIDLRQGNFSFGDPISAPVKVTLHTGIHTFNKHKIIESSKKSQSSIYEANNPTLKYKSRNYSRDNDFYSSWPKAIIEVKTKKGITVTFDSLTRYIELVGAHKIRRVLYFNEKHKIIISGLEKAYWDDPGNTKRKSTGWHYAPFGTWKYFDDNGKLLLKKKYKKQKTDRASRKREKTYHQYNLDPEF